MSDRIKATIFMVAWIGICILMVLESAGRVP